MGPWLLSALAVAAPSVDEPLRTGARAPADAAVVVGVEDYAFVEDVPYARRDANAVYTWLIYGRGVPQDRVELLTDASREQVLAAVDRAVERVGDGGMLWVYWAGHGSASPEDGSRLLLGVDVMPEADVFASRGVAVAELQDRMKGVDNLLWLDTCYTGAARSGGSLLPGTRLAVPVWATEPEGRSSVWTATKGRQVSAGYDEAQHGLFTYASLGALRGWADGEIDGTPDGKVTVDEAHAYTRRRVAELGGHTQNPRWFGPRDLVLAPVAPESTPPPRAVMNVLGSTGVDAQVEDWVGLIGGATDGGLGLSGGGPAPDDGREVDPGRTGRTGGTDEAAQRSQARQEAERRRRLEAEKVEVAGRATADFRAIAGDAESGRRASEVVLTEYLQTWRDPHADFEGEAIPLQLPVVERAEKLLDAYPERRRARAANIRLAIGGGVLAGATISGIGALATKAAYVNEPLTGEDRSGLYNANRGLAYTAVGLAVVGSGVAITGAFR